jgi:hypothetical protein
MVTDDHGIDLAHFLTSAYAHPRHLPPKKYNVDSAPSLDLTRLAAL